MILIEFISYQLQAEKRFNQFKLIINFYTYRRNQIFDQVYICKYLFIANLIKIYIHKSLF